MFNINRSLKQNYKFYITVFITILCFITTLISVGFGALNQELNIAGDVEYDEHSRLLYDVLRKAANVGTYAKEYTGSHHDSFTEVPTKSIYHWYGSDDTNGTAILDKNNVIFADHCWQMIRTTDTGGVKMVYNGEVDNNQCLDSRRNHSGYSGFKTLTLSDTYYYGTDFVYDKSTSNYTLAGTVTTGSIQTGLYTCRSTSATDSCSMLYFVDSQISGTTYSVLTLWYDYIYSEIGTSQYNDYRTSVSNVGYMQNIAYHYSYNNTNDFDETIFPSPFTSLTTSYYFADSYDYNETNAGKYTLTDPFTLTSTSNYSSLVGKYTFLNTSSTYSSTSIYYIAAIDASNGTKMYYIELSGGNDLSYYNHTYTYGDSYTDNGNGTFTINNPTTINRSDYYNNYSSMKNKFICKNAVNNTCNDVWHSTSYYTTNMKINYYRYSNAYKYANGFTYDSGTNTFRLNSDSVMLWDIEGSNFNTDLKNYHYTCFNTTGECSTLFYVYEHGIGAKAMYYIKLNNGKTIEEAFEEMLSSDDVNQFNSSIKTVVDLWYERNLNNYTNYIEDTIYCNNRSIDNIAGWDPNGGNVGVSLSFNPSYNSFVCQNVTDQFSISNNKAKLLYPIGLLTYSEVYLLGNKNARKAPRTYWLMSPGSVSADSYNSVVSTDGSIGIDSMEKKDGIRPAISLKYGTEYISGNGSKSDPYVVDTNSNSG